MSAADQMVVRVDDREARSGVVAALQQQDDVQVIVQRLDIGDYEVDGRLLVERKTLPDFALSIVDGRLFQQAHRLADAAWPAAMLLEGTATDLATCHMRREALQGALITLSLIFGLPVLRSLSPEESARLMVYAGRQIRATARGAFPRHGYRPKGKRKRQLYILQGLPGIGPARAERLLERFGNVESVLRADAAQLRDVPGIGDHIADAIRWAVSEDPGVYELADL